MADDQAYTGGELAALLVMFFRNSDGQANPYNDFPDQLTRSATVGTGADFEKARNAAEELYKRKPYLIDAVHQTVRSALTELELLRDQSGNKLWSSCKLVSATHVLMLCKEGQP
jgi:hypothetical protein